MTVDLIFGERLNRITRDVVDPSSRDVAEKRHANGDQYCVLVRRRSGGLAAAIELKAKQPAAGVHFYDDAERPYMTCLFRAAMNKVQLFMCEVRFTEYADDRTREWIRGDTIFVRERDRALFLTTVNKVANLLDEKEGFLEEAELALHYEDVPAFGDYASLLRTDRDRPIDAQPEDSPSWLVVSH